MVKAELFPVSVRVLGVGLPYTIVTSLFGGRFSVILAVTGALIIQAMNTGILLSGYRPELNLVVKAVVVIAVLLLQSPRVAGLGTWFRKSWFNRKGST